jgi:hypothetical protein
MSWALPGPIPAPSRSVSKNKTRPDFVNVQAFGSSYIWMDPDFPIGAVLRESANFFAIGAEMVPNSLNRGRKVIYYRP